MKPPADAASPGIHTISAEDYHSDPVGLSLTSSIARVLVNQTPLHAWSQHPKLNPAYHREEKAIFDNGTVLHSLILEEDSSGVHVIDAPDWRKTIVKEERDEARKHGKIPMLEKDFSKARAVAWTARQQFKHRHDDPPLFSDGKAEQTLIWEEQGITCRARLDWLRDDLSAIDDLKTTSKSANPVVWSRNMYAIGGDIQVAFYLRGLQALTERVVFPQFRFVIVENHPPYAMSVVQLSDSALELGQSKVARAIQLWSQCLETNTWPGYGDGVFIAEAPTWEMNAWLEQDGEVLT